MSVERSDADGDTPEPATEAARLAAMVAGLNAIVWERDPRTWEVRWVNGRIAEVLGYPVEQWRADPDLWRRALHPADRDEAMATVRAATAERSDFSLTYRVLTVDGRLVWLHHMGHVAVDGAGRATALHAVLVDVTDTRRRERAARISAAVGSALAAPTPLHRRLQQIVGLLAGEVCDRAAVWLRDDDGRHVAVAAAPPELAARLLALAPVTAPPEVEAAYERGEPLVLEPVTEAMMRAATDDEEHYAAIAAATPPGAQLLVPLNAADGTVIGTLTLDLVEVGRHHERADVTLAADLGRRIATTASAERAADRQHRLHEISVALSAAGSVAEAAEALATGIRAALAADVVTVCTLGEDGLLHPVHTLGYPDRRLDRYAGMRLSAPFPLTAAARTGTPRWVADRAAWERDYPDVVPDLLDGTQAAAALPLLVGERVIGAVGVTFRTARRFDAGTRAFLLTLASQVAVAVERAALADVRRDVAETLQRSLLPRTLPRLERLAVEARYLPGVRGTRAGGDWYDVLPLPDGRIALVVGDVVGEGAPAAAVMGQLRSALATLLLEGHEPAAALDLLDRFARTVEGAQVSTATCLLLDPGTRVLLHASAGHPPPLVLGSGTAGYLAGGGGAALALPDAPVRSQGSVTLAPGATLILYTDGLVERRGATVDDGMDRLVEVATAARSSGVQDLLDAVLEGLVGDGPTDDVAVVAARLTPVPLLLDQVADSASLRDVRRRVRAWAASAALDPDTTDDLLLAIGEAAANAVEHAYGGAPGRLRVTATVEGGERVAVTVADEGRWRPEPADPGFRGRGLQVLRELGDGSLAVDRGPEGTVVRLAVPLPAGRTDHEDARTGEAAGPARVGVAQRDGTRYVALTGELDLDGVPAVRAALREALDGPEPVVLDLTGLAALSSSGLGLLLELTRPRPGRPVPSALLPENGPVRRLLDMTGLAGQLRGGSGQPAERRG